MYPSLPVSAILKKNAGISQRIVINPDELDMSPFLDMVTRVAIVLFEIWQATNEIPTENLSYHNFGHKYRRRHLPIVIT